MTATELAPPSTLIDRVVAAFRDTGRPLTFVELKKELPKPEGTGSKRYEDELREALLSAERAGRLFKWTPKADKNESPRFGAQDEKRFAENLVLDLLRDGDLPATRIAAEMDKRLPKTWSGTWRLEFVNELVQARKLFRVGTKLSRNAPDANALLNKALSKGAKESLARALDTFRKQGLDVDALVEAVRSFVLSAAATPAAAPAAEAAPAGDRLEPEPMTELDQVILKGLLDLQAENGSVDFAELRRHLPAEYHADGAFESALFRLVAAGKIDLHAHDDSTPGENGMPHQVVRDAAGKSYARASLKGHSA